MKKMIEGSMAVALAVKMCRPGVVSAYPITPQTHIVEYLADFFDNGEAVYDYVRAESEFAAASIALGASAAGVRSYTATSSQGLLLMTEVLFNIAGMRLPIVLTCANRAVSAPINIWNDHEDAMTVRDSGWIMLFAEDNQEALDLHLQAFNIAEATRLPVMVNFDGFVLTHTFEPVDVPEQKLADRYVRKFTPPPGEFLDPKKPRTLGHLAFPDDYFLVRKQLHEDLIKSQETIKKEFLKFKKIFNRGLGSGLVEYIGRGNEKMVVVAMGSVVGTIKNQKSKIKNQKFGRFAGDFGILKIRTFRPWPEAEILNALESVKRVLVLDKAISLGAGGILADEIRKTVQGKLNCEVKSFIGGLGGKDITEEMIGKMINDKGEAREVFLE